MSTTQHPLTEDAAAEMWATASRLPWMGLPALHRPGTIAALRAAFDAGREHERTTPADPHHDPRPWQDCTREDICKGDLVEVRIWDDLRVGVAHYQDDDGDWETRGGWTLTFGNDARHPLRRIPAPTPPAEEVELPSEFGAVIRDVEDNNSATYDRMVFDGTCYCRHDTSRIPEDVWAFTLPDGTRARRDGDPADGRPRFVKEMQA